MNFILLHFIGPSALRPQIPTTLSPAPVPSQVCSPPKLVPDDGSCLPGSFGRCPCGRKNPISCQTPGLYCWRGDNPNRSASHTPALSHCLIIVAVVAASVSPLGLSVLTVFAAFSCWQGGGQLRSPGCDLLRVPERPSLRVRSLAHQPETSLTCWQPPPLTPDA